MKVKINNEEYELFTKPFSKKELKKIKAKDIPRDKEGNIDFSKLIEEQNKKQK